MSMPELTDDQLDGLFRKSVEEFDTPFDPAAWQDMKARLDANDRTTPSSALIWKNLLRWGLPVALLMLLIGGGWFVYRTADSDTTTTSVQKVAEADVNENTIVKGGNEPETPRLAEPQRPTDLAARSAEQRGSTVGASAKRVESAKEPGSRVSEVVRDPLHTVSRSTRKPGSLEARVEKSDRMNPTTTTEPDRTALPKTSVATKSAPLSYKLASGRNRTRRMQPVLEPVEAINAEETTNRLSSIPLSGSRVSGRKLRKQRNVSRGLVGLPATGYTGSTRPTFTKRSIMDNQRADQAMGSGVTDSPLPSELTEPASGLLLTVNELSVRPARWTKSLTFSNRPVEVHPDTTAQRAVSKPPVPVQRGLSVRFVVAPDLSTIGLKNFARPGTNVGLLLEYRLAPRWSIQAGLIQSTKVYKALPNEYTAPYGVWGGKVVPENIDGRCSMFDIPINLRYDFIVKAKPDRQLVNRWFISGGVTNYIIKQEDYHYNYKPHSTYTQRTDTTTNTGGYGLSNLNVSIGYERSFSRRLSWQVEPFMKVPLKGVGFFKIDLLSTGAFFSLRYKL